MADVLPSPRFECTFCRLARTAVRTLIQADDNPDSIVDLFRERGERAGADRPRQATTSAEP
jgi:hypothetical protein